MFSYYFDSDVKKLYRYAHTDIPRLNFEEYRRKSTQDSEKPAAENIEKRKALSCVASFSTQKDFITIFLLFL